MNEREAFRDIAENYNKRIIAVVYKEDRVTRFCKIDNITIDDHGHVFIYAKQPYSFSRDRPKRNGVET